MAAEGRPLDQALILPGLSPVIAATRPSAAHVAQLNDLLIEIGRKRLSGRFGGHDFSHLPLDKALSVEDFPTRPRSRRRAAAPR